MIKSKNIPFMSSTICKYQITIYSQVTFIYDTCFSLFPNGFAKFNVTKLHCEGFLLRIGQMFWQCSGVLWFVYGKLTAARAASRRQQGAGPNRPKGEGRLLTGSLRPVSRPSTRPESRGRTRTAISRYCPPEAHSPSRTCVVDRIIRFAILCNPKMSCRKINVHIRIDMPLLAKFKKHVHSFTV